MEKIIWPLWSGSLRLASTDVRVNPIVRFRNPGDVERCVNGTRKIGDVLRSRSMEDFKWRECFGGRDFRYVGPALPVNDRLMGEFCRRTVSTIWNYHGGCLVINYLAKQTPSQSPCVNKETVVAELQHPQCHCSDCDAIFHIYHMPLSSPHHHTEPHTCISLSNCQPHFRTSIRCQNPSQFLSAKVRNLTQPCRKAVLHPPYPPFLQYLLPLIVPW